jgi:hypothetical protein
LNTQPSGFPQSLAAFADALTEIVGAVAMSASISTIVIVQYLGVSAATTYYNWLLAFTACFEPYNPEALGDYSCIVILILCVDSNTFPGYRKPKLSR